MSKKYLHSFTYPKTGIPSVDQALENIKKELIKIVTIVNSEEILPHTHPGSDITSQVSDADTVDGYHLDQDVRTTAFPHWQGHYVNKGAVAFYQNVAHYSEGGNPLTGTMKITLPKSWSNTMVVVRVVGYDYSGHSAWQAVISFYNYSGTPNYYNYSAQILGNPPFSQVRLAHDGTYCCILLGDTSTNWSYPKMVITEVLCAYRNYTGWESGWSITRITDESGITVYKTITPSLITQRLTIGSYKLDSLVANNKVPDSDKLDGYHASSFALASQAVPSGMIAIFQGSCPSGWTRVSDFDGKFLRGASTYGGTGGSSSHSHTVDPPSTNTSGILSDDWFYQNATSGSYDISWRHHHSVDIGSFSSGSASHLPPYIDVVFCKKD